MTIREFFSEMRRAFGFLWRTVLDATLGEAVTFVAGATFVLCVVGLYFFWRETGETRR